MTAREDLIKRFSDYGESVGNRQHYRFVCIGLIDRIGLSGTEDYLNDLIGYNP